MNDNDAYIHLLGVLGRSVVVMQRTGASREAIGKAMVAIGLQTWGEVIGPACMAEQLASLTTDFAEIAGLDVENLEVSATNH